MLRAEGERVGALGITTFRPWPSEEVRRALRGANAIVVIEKALAVGIGGVVSLDVRVALSGMDQPCTRSSPVSVDGRSQRRRCTSCCGVRRGELPELTFLDLDRGLVERELARRGAKRKSGPHAENLLRDLGAVAAGPV